MVKGGRPSIMVIMARKRREERERAEREAQWQQYRKAMLAAGKLPELQLQLPIQAGGRTS
jgi:hypothetical protein